MPATEFGEMITELKVVPLPAPYHEADGSLVGHILHIDSFGNLITNIRSSDLPKEKISIVVGKQHIHGISQFYAGTKGLAAVMGSSGYLEVSLRDGSACDFLGTTVGDK
jgi:S-adenosylmethionine hydrolase